MRAIRGLACAKHAETGVEGMIVLSEQSQVVGHLQTAYSSGQGT